MNVKNVTSYRSFLADKKSNKGKFVMTPKKLLIDPDLTPKEKILWQTLAAFQYGPENEIFPSRRRLADLTGIRSPNSISKLTRRLQDKAYLTKFYDEYRRVFYRLYFCADVDEERFWEKASRQEELAKSEHNRISYIKNTPNDEK